MSASASTTTRSLVLAGGLAGALGVVLSAAQAHTGGAFMGTAANMLLVHAPALLTIGINRANAVLRLAGLLLVAGLVLFCGDLLSRDFLGGRLFPFAAPTGGTLLILAWLVAGSSALAGREN
jgi:uncharacterized membrane protein YgdD (TMEM256/DUF423 family)